MNPEGIGKILKDTHTRSIFEKNRTQFDHFLGAIFFFLVPLVLTVKAAEGEYEGVYLICKKHDEIEGVEGV